MSFGNRRINKNKIPRVNSTTCLDIDDKFNWENHILSIRSKLSKCCAIIFSASSVINKHRKHFCTIFVLQYTVTHMLQIFIV